MFGLQQQDIKNLCFYALGFIIVLLIRTYQFYSNLYLQVNKNILSFQQTFQSSYTFVSLGSIVLSLMGICIILISDNADSFSKFQANSSIFGFSEYIKNIADSRLVMSANEMWKLLNNTTFKQEISQKILNFIKNDELLNNEFKEQLKQNFLSFIEQLKKKYNSDHSFISNFINKETNNIEITLENTIELLSKLALQVYSFLKNDVPNFVQKQSYYSESESILNNLIKLLSLSDSNVDINQQIESIKNLAKENIKFFEEISEFVLEFVELIKPYYKLLKENDKYALYIKKLLDVIFTQTGQTEGTSYLDTIYLKYNTEKIINTSNINTTDRDVIIGNDFDSCVPVSKNTQLGQFGTSDNPYYNPEINQKIFNFKESLTNISKKYSINHNMIYGMDKYNELVTQKTIDKGVTKDPIIDFYIKQFNSVLEFCKLFVLSQKESYIKEQVFRPLCRLFICYKLNYNSNQLYTLDSHNLKTINDLTNFCLNNLYNFFESNLPVLQYSVLNIMSVIYKNIVFPSDMNMVLDKNFTMPSTKNYSRELVKHLINKIINEDFLFNTIEDIPTQIHFIKTISSFTEQLTETIFEIVELNSSPVGERNPIIIIGRQLSLLFNIALHSNKDDYKEYEINNIINFLSTNQELLLQPFNLINLASNVRFYKLPDNQANNGNHKIDMTKNINVLMKVLNDTALILHPTNYIEFGYEIPIREMLRIHRNIKNALLDDSTNSKISTIANLISTSESESDSYGTFVSKENQKEAYNLLREYHNKTLYEQSVNKFVANNIDDIIKSKISKFDYNLYDSNKNQSLINNNAIFYPNENKSCKNIFESQVKKRSQQLLDINSIPTFVTFMTQGLEYLAKPQLNQTSEINRLFRESLTEMVQLHDKISNQMILSDDTIPLESLITKSYRSKEIRLFSLIQLIRWESFSHNFSKTSIVAHQNNELPIQYMDKLNQSFFNKQNLIALTEKLCMHNLIMVEENPLVQFNLLKRIYDIANYYIVSNSDQFSTTMNSTEYNNDSIDKNFADYSYIKTQENTTVKFSNDYNNDNMLKTIKICSSLLQTFQQDKSKLVKSYSDLFTSYFKYQKALNSDPTYSQLSLTLTLINTIIYIWSLIIKILIVSLNYSAPTISPKLISIMAIIFASIFITFLIWEVTDHGQKIFFNYLNITIGMPFFYLLDVGSSIQLFLNKITKYKHGQSDPSSLITTIINDPTLKIVNFTIMNLLEYIVIIFVIHNLNFRRISIDSIKITKHKVAIYGYQNYIKYLAKLVSKSSTKN